MDDCASAVLQIGGKVRRSDIDEIAEAAHEDGAGKDYRRAETDDLRRMIEVAAQNSEPLFFTADDAISGAFDRLEATCRELDLPYVRHTGACVGAWSEHVEFGNPQCILAQLTGTPAAAMAGRCSIAHRSAVSLWPALSNVNFK